MNHNTITMQYGKDSPGVVKSYHELARFLSELQYLPYFRSFGFRVPKIIRYDQSRLEIELEYVAGEVHEALSDAQLKACVATLASIHRQCRLKTEKAQVVDAYIHSLTTGLQALERNRGFELNNDRLATLLALLRQHFEPGIFKDAKSANWIFTQNGLALIDFDYVRPSFFLADVAQLLNSQPSEVMLEELVDEYVRIAQPAANLPRELVRTLYKLASLNAKLASIRHSPSLPSDARSELEDTAKILLDKLGIAK